MRLSLSVIGLTLISIFAKAQAPTAESYSEFHGSAIPSLGSSEDVIDFRSVNYPLLQATIFKITNKERKKANLSPFEFDSKIEQVASAHARDMVKYGFYSHTSKIRIKRTVQDRFHLEGLNPKYYGENICSTFGLQYQSGRKVNPPYPSGVFTYAFTSKRQVIPPHTYSSFAKEVVRLWMNSPSHRQNILNPNFTTLGCGASLYFEKKFYNMPYFKVVQNFGSD